MEFFHALLTLDGWIALLTLTLLEIVLGVDNIIFISILAAKVRKEEQRKTRNTGLLLTLVTRILLLLGIGWIVSLKSDVFVLFGNGYSWRDIILILGGLFLMYKSVTEIHSKVSGVDEEVEQTTKASVRGVILQIILIDVVFSFDSILTAVGIVDELVIMILAVIIAMIVMILFAKAISDFINERPTIKMIALAFLLTIGLMLVLEGYGEEVPKGYIYFAMVYALLVEFLNIRMRKNQEKKKKGTAA
ncbi:TerC family protein [Wandonia haliotis]|uniref:TerC family protein n=1 Tax=Wandonia haliotis TaxID=574963 RepID=A0ABN1MPD0_9FLAO